MRLAQHDAAQGSYSQAIGAYEAALMLAPEDVEALNNQGNAGNLEMHLAQHENAQESYSLAIAAYEAALVLAPDYLNALNNKGLALQRRAELWLTLSDNAQAFADLQAAQTLWTRSLELAPDQEQIGKALAALTAFLEKNEAE